MKTLKRTLAALAALTVASISCATVAFADETTEEVVTTEATSEDATGSTDASEDSTDSSEETTAEATTGEETTAAATTAAATEAPTDAATDGGINDPSAAVKVGGNTVEVKEAEAGSTVNAAVEISGNPGFASTGFKLAIDPALTYNSVEGGLIQGATVVADGSDVAVTSGSSSDITGDGALFSVAVTVPADAKAGDTYSIGVTVLTFANVAGDNVSVAVAPVTITVVGEETTAAPTESSEAPSTVTEKVTAKATVKKAAGSPATGEALPIAGAVAAIAVIGGVAVASKKRK